MTKATNTFEMRASAFVDGELSEHEVYQLLRELRDDPEGFDYINDCLDTGRTMRAEGHGHADMITQALSSTSRKEVKLSKIMDKPRQGEGKKAMSRWPVVGQFALAAGVAGLALTFVLSNQSTLGPSASGGATILSADAQAPVMGYDRATTASFVDESHSEFPVSSDIVSEKDEERATPELIME